MDLNLGQFLTSRTIIYGNNQNRQVRVWKSLVRMSFFDKRAKRQNGGVTQEIGEYRNI